MHGALENKDYVCLHDCVMWRYCARQKTLWFALKRTGKWETEMEPIKNLPAREAFTLMPECASFMYIWKAQVNYWWYCSVFPSHFQSHFQSNIFHLVVLRVILWPDKFHPTNFKENAPANGINRIRQAQISIHCTEGLGRVKYLILANKCSKGPSI